MSKAYAIIADGMGFSNLEAANSAIDDLRDRNAVVWFVVFKVLQRIRDEWDEGMLPRQRADHIEEAFQDQLVAVLKDADEDNLVAVKGGLERLVKTYVREFVAS